MLENGRSEHGRPRNVVPVLKSGQYEHGWAKNERAVLEKGENEHGKHKEGANVLEKGEDEHEKHKKGENVLEKGENEHGRDKIEETEYKSTKDMSIFKDKTLMITGGTGSFGNAVLRRFLKTDIKEIRIFSRDEKKQDDMRHECQVKYPEVAHKIKFYIGDVRNRSTLKSAVRGVDYIFHAAALKQVPSCEFFPMEAVKTNVIGTDNVLDAAIDAGVVKRAKTRTGSTKNASLC